MATRTTTRADLFDQVTTQIVAQLERGVRPWHQPWDSELAFGPISRPLRHNGKSYQGVNVLLLWAAAHERGYANPYWITYKQAESLGGYVRKGEHGCKVIYAASVTKTDVFEDGTEVERDVFFRRQYTVFNAEQCQGLPWKYYRQPGPAKPLQRIEQAERFFRNARADVRYGGFQAYYSPNRDFIGMPPRDSFRNAEGHAATLAHEFVHWTGHASRLDRNLAGRWADDDYAMEELIARLAPRFSAPICASRRKCGTITPATSTTGYKS